MKVRKNVEALGRLDAKIVATDEGSLMMAGMAAMIPDARVVMRKPC